jgi:hypothetical protein
MSTTKRDELLPPVNLDDLTKAIINNAINNHEIIPENEARQVATYVLNFFGYSSRIADNRLEPDDRDTFYMLEDSGLLTTDNEETRLYDGREWRIHYWLFKKETINKLAKQNNNIEEPGISKAKVIYNQVPDEAWGYLAENRGAIA